MHKFLYTKLAAITFCCMVFFNTARGQWVTIPDTTFVSWLQGHGFATCMNGNQLDTTCSAVLNANSISCSNLPIRDLTGLQYFKNLQILDCNSDSLYTLPTLPASLTDLYCAYNQLSTLPSLPATLTSLACSFNRLSTLPPLPASLAGTLYCSDNQLSALPDLPINLTDLECYSNQLSSLPVLPANLTTLECSYNQLSTLPALPANLTTLECSYNHLSTLPALPANLVTLYCQYNQLSTLPALPATLRTLYCRFNSLSTLPSLPDSLFILDVSINPYLTCLPELKKITYFYFGTTPLTCLPDYGIINNSTPSLSSLPLCGIFNYYGCRPFWNISGRCFYDGNSNCVFDSTDAGTNYVKTQLYNHGTLVQQAFSGGEGFYSFDSVVYGNYTVIVDTSNLPFIVDCPGPGNYSDTLSSTDSLVYNNNFAFKCRTTGYDIGVKSVVYYNTPRPNAVFGLNTAAGDMSQLYGANCAAGIGGQVQLTYSGQLGYVGPAAQALSPSSVTGNTITWTIADFGAVNVYSAFNLFFRIDSLATPGTQACFTVSVTPTTGDYNPGNNTLSYCFAILNALDPNEKEVYPSGTVDTSQHWLTYTIRFQNTGTAPALNIRITDTLDSNLDPSTIQLLAFSAENLTQVFGNLVVFNFPDINLADSATSQPLSTGYVQYRIKIKSNLPYRTSIANTASIYFDNNLPVVTNTVTNTLCHTLYTTLTDTIPCGDSVSVGSNSYHLGGTYTDTLLSSQGCDSIVTLNLFAVGDTVSLFKGLCAGDSIYFFGAWIHHPGQYDTIVHGRGTCDTMASISVVVQDPLPPHHTKDTICGNDSLLFAGQYLHTSGVYSHIGCDSSVILTLTVLATDSTIMSHSICGNDSFYFNGHYLHAAGTYEQILSNRIGCDSFIILHLTAGNDTILQYGGLCAGDSIYFYGTWIYHPAQFDTILPGHGTCDTFASITLAVIDPLPPHHTYDTICGSDSLLFTGQYLHTSGVYSHIHCDSSVILTLTVLPADSTVLNQSICGNDSFYFNGHYLHATGTYEQILSNHIGCDSFIILNLTAGGYDSINQFGGLCAGDSFYFYGMWIHHPGQFDTILPGHGTCDTVASIFLAVQDPLPPHYIYDTICNNDSLLFAGTYVHTSGVYSHISCDSSVVLTLTAGNTDTSSISHSICAGDTFRIWNHIYTQSGHYSDTLTNMHGCDSIVKLALTVNPLPVVTFSWDSLLARHELVGILGPTAGAYCFPPFTNASFFLLIGGLPVNGYYTGEGISHDTLYADHAFYPYTTDTILYNFVDSNNCRNNIVLTLKDLACDAISEVNTANTINLYPNPASTTVYIKTENLHPTQLRLYNVARQLIQSGRFEPEIDISHLSSGVYFVEITAGSEVARKRFVKIN